MCYVFFPSHIFKNDISITKTTFTACNTKKNLICLLYMHRLSKGRTFVIFKASLIHPNKSVHTHHVIQHSIPILPRNYNRKHLLYLSPGGHFDSGFCICRITILQYVGTSIQYQNWIGHLQNA